MASDTQFLVVRRLLEKHGWTLSRINGSHHVFIGQGRPLISIPVHRGKVKSVYVRRIEKAIRELGQDDA